MQSPVHNGSLIPPDAANGPFPLPALPVDPRCLAGRLALPLSVSLTSLWDFL